jgi:hypothetical protein
VLLFVLVGIGLFIYWHRPSIDLIGWLHEDIGRYFVVCFLILLVSQFLEL